MQANHIMILYGFVSFILLIFVLGLVIPETIKKVKDRKHKTKMNDIFEDMEFDEYMNEEDEEESIDEEDIDVKHIII